MQARLKAQAKLLGGTEFLPPLRPGHSMLHWRCRHDLGEMPNPIGTRDRSRTLTAPHVPSSYRELVQQTPAPSDPPTRNPEEELDSLLSALDGRREQTADRNAGFSADPIQRLRELTLSELVPVFVELVEKYSQSGISLQMDASNFLQGGREIKFEFGIGGWRSHLQGTVTADAIAFHEWLYTRRSRRAAQRPHVARAGSQRRYLPQFRLRTTHRSAS